MERVKKFKSHLVGPWTDLSHGQLVTTASPKAMGKFVSQELTSSIEEGTGKEYYDACASMLLHSWACPTTYKIDPTTFMDPKSLEDIYGIHDAIEARVAGKYEWEIAGYKLGAMNAIKQRDGTLAPALCAPLFRKYVVANSFLTFHSLGAFGVEAEIGFIMGQTLDPENAPFSRQDVISAIRCVCLTIEVIGTRFQPGATRTQNFCDCICSGGVIIGPSIPKDQFENLDCLKDIDVSLYINGNLTESGSTNDVPLSDPLSSLVWLANHLAERGKSLKVGQLVISGKCCASSEINPYDRISVKFDGIGKVQTYLLP